MEYLLTIPGKLPGLNDYISAERANRHKRAKMKAVKRERGRRGHHAVLKGREGPGPCIHRLPVGEGVLRDDGWKYIVGFSDRFEVDKRDPRIEVTIREV